MTTEITHRLTTGELRSKIAELSAVLRHFNRTGIYMAIDESAFRYLADFLCQMKEDLARLESEELMNSCKLIKSN